MRGRLFSADGSGVTKIAESYVPADFANDLIRLDSIQLDL